MKSNPQLLAVISEWDKAEEAIKLAEQICGSVVIPSVMELRYAGRRIGDAFKALEIDENETLANEYLVDARFDCLRAQHDAVDVAVNYMASFADQVLLKTEPLALEGQYGKIKSFIMTISKMQSKVSESRRKRDDREKLYAELTDDLRALKPEFDKIKIELVEMIRLSDEFYKKKGDRKGIIEEAYSARRARNIYAVTTTSVAASALIVFLIQRFLNL